MSQYPANLSSIVTCSHASVSPGADTTVTIAAEADRIPVIWKITASYSTAPGGVEILKAVAGGSTTIFQVGLPAAAGVYDFDFPMGLTNNEANEAVVVTLSDPGGAVVAHLNVEYSL